MMRLLFVDTAGWMASAEAADAAHEKSCEARDAALKERGCPTHPPFSTGTGLAGEWIRWTGGTSPSPR